MSELLIVSSALTGVTRVTNIIMESIIAKCLRAIFYLSQNQILKIYNLITYMPSLPSRTYLKMLMFVKPSSHHLQLLMPGWLLY